MDEYRGRYQGYDREQHHHSEPAAHHPEPESPRRGIIPSLGIGGDFLDDYLPILLVILGAVGVYLLLSKNGGGFSGLLDGFLK